MNALTELIIPPCATANATTYIVTTIIATLLIALSKGGFGGGIGVLATPLFLLVLPANVALSMILPILIVCDIFTLRKFPKTWDRQGFTLLAGGTSIGLVVGLLSLIFFARSDVNGENLIRLSVAVISVLFCVLQMAKFSMKRKIPEIKIGTIPSFIIGIMCGITTMVAHAAGLIVSMFLLTRKLDPQRFVGTTARYYLLFNTVKIPLYILATMLSQKPYITIETIKWDIWLLPFCPIGVGIGAWLNKRLSSTVFTIIIYIFLFLTSSKMIYESL